MPLAGLSSPQIGSRLGLHPCKHSAPKRGMGRRWKEGMARLQLLAARAVMSARSPISIGNYFKRIAESVLAPCL